MRLASLLTVLLLLACPLARHAFAADAPDAQRPAEPPPGASLPQPDATRVARNGNGEEVAVKSIDDPANPYAGKYSALDRWLYEHYTPHISESDNIKSQSDWQALLARY